MTLSCACEDKDGNVTVRKVKQKAGGRAGGDADDLDTSEAYAAEDDYFETGPDGSLILKPGRKRIDLSRIQREDLIRMGIDPNLQKSEIMRLLKVQLFSQAAKLF
ncbi:unnamed protein product [Protopolystoma xenopodis]|uniref:Uncharacterized protein n=1 Tax=Protopolystoma xenopodis TaxID=117903 RepID=A0A3S5C4A2_9PLAT|nr:unnamed protein product [Protopolystoma xenopodis]